MPKRQNNYRWKSDIIKKKRQEAEERAKIYSSLSLKEKLDLIAKRPGNSAKEKTKLEAQVK